MLVSDVAVVNIGDFRNLRSEGGGGRDFPSITPKADPPMEKRYVCEDTNI